MSLGDGHTVVRREPLVIEFVAGHADADHVVVADLLAYLVEHLEAEAHAIFQAAAVFIRALVGLGRPERVDQGLEGAVDFEAVEVAFLAAPGRLAEGLDDPAEIPFLHLLGMGAMVGLAHPRRPDGGQPRIGLPLHLAADMGQLNHQLGAVAHGRDVR